MLPSTCAREALLACPPSPAWNMSSLWSSLFPLHALALITPLTHQVRLSLTLTFSSLIIWYSGQTALFLFLLAKTAPAYLPTAFSVAPRSLFSFRQAQFVQVFLLKPAPFCVLFAGLGSTIKCATSLLLLSDSRSVLSSIFPSTTNFVADLAETAFSLNLFYQATMGPRHSFLPGNDAADELARRGALLAPSAMPCSVSPLVSRIHSCLISDWRRTVSSKFFDIPFASISTKELVLPRHARCILSRLGCKGHSLLLSSYFSRIGRIENSSCSACEHTSQDNSHLILHCPATDSLRHSLFGDSLSLRPLVQTLGVTQFLRLHSLPPCSYPS